MFRLMMPYPWKDEHPYKAECRKARPLRFALMSPRLTAGPDKLILCQKIESYSQVGETSEMRIVTSKEPVL